jgi:predicted PurR-regulated permease PerM
METLKVPGYIKVVFIALLIIIIIWFMIVAKALLVPLFISGFIAMLLTSACNRLERRKIPRSVSAAICLAFFIIVLFGILFFIYIQIRTFMADLGDTLTHKLNDYAIQANLWFLRAPGL